MASLKLNRVQHFGWKFPINSALVRKNVGICWFLHEFSTIWKTDGNIKSNGGPDLAPRPWVYPIICFPIFHTYLNYIINAQEESPWLYLHLCSGWEHFHDLTLWSSLWSVLLEQKLWSAGKVSSPYWGWCEHSLGLCLKITS